MKILKKIRLKHILRMMAPSLAILYVHCMIHFPLDPFKLTPILLAKIFFIAIVCNLGLAIITLNVAKTYKKISTLFFIPSITTTPVIVGLYFIPAYLIIFVVKDQMLNY